jgi:hypothetical protein
MVMVLLIALLQGDQDALAARLGSFDPRERASARAALAILQATADSLTGAIAKACAGDAAGRDRLLAAVKEKGPLRTAAGVALAALADPRDVTTLLDLLRDPDLLFLLPFAEAFPGVDRPGPVSTAVQQRLGLLYRDVTPAGLVERMALMLALGPMYAAGLSTFAQQKDPLVRRAAGLALCQSADSSYGPSGIIAYLQGEAGESLSAAELDLFAAIAARCCARYDSSAQSLFNLGTKTARAVRKAYLRLATTDWGAAGALVPLVGLGHSADDLVADIETALRALTKLEPKGSTRDERAVAWREHFASRRRQAVDSLVPGAIDAGVLALKSRQAADGSWSYNGRRAGDEYAVGMTALAVYTLLSMDVPAKDPVVAKGLAWLLKNQPFGTGTTTTVGHPTYETSLLAVAMSEAIQRKSDLAERCQGVLQRCVDWLSSAQHANGSWDYQKAATRHDHSNMQFAVMALRAAVNAGVRVKKETWERACNHWKLAQTEDGGWDYMSQYGNRGAVSSPAMTGAGVMGLVMAMASMVEKPDAAELAKDATVKKGLEALAKHAASAMSLNYYWLYSLERACMVTQTELLGGLDWYSEGAWLIVRAQAADGTWSGSYGASDHCFALLFLHRSHVAVGTPRARKPGDPREKE